MFYGRPGMCSCLIYFFFDRSVRMFDARPTVCSYMICVFGWSICVSRVQDIDICALYS